VLVFFAAAFFLVMAILTGNPLAYLAVALFLAGGTVSLLTARRLDRR
jgi:hypothetical protein